MEGPRPDQSGGNAHEQDSKSNKAFVRVEIEAGGTHMSSGRRMRKVPDFLRQEEEHKNYNYKNDYDPAVVSFGPYHHGKPELKVVEDFKPKSLEIFAAGTGRDVDFFYNKVLEVIDKVRRCYIENSTDEYNDAVFARMMLLDACFIIYFVELNVKLDRDVTEHTLIQLGFLTCSLALRDMHLLENQIPYWFLKLLIRLKYDKDEGEEMLKKFLSINVFGDYEHIGGRTRTVDQEEPIHLLEAFRLTLLADYSEYDETNRWSWSVCGWLGLPSIATIGKACQHYLPKFAWIRKSKTMYYRGPKLKKRTKTFNSVTDLKAKGVYFRPSPTDSITDIGFVSSFIYGTLQLPTMKIRSFTRACFLNMVAFEMCPDKFTDLVVSSYINFMQSLIQSSEDVIELQEKQIIVNGLGSNEQVMQVYNSINTYGMDNNLTLYSIKERVLEQYDSMGSIWLAELVHTYFNSPWSAIGLLAACFLLCLTVIQTYFTIHPLSN